MQVNNVKGQEVKLKNQKERENKKNLNNFKSSESHVCKGLYRGPGQEN